MPARNFAIISDVHANAEALKEVLKDISRRSGNGGIRQIISAGDHFGYGPRPTEVADTLMALYEGGILTAVPGNHDDVVTGKNLADEFNDVAKQSVLHQMKHIKGHTVDWTKNLSEATSYSFGDSDTCFGITHGSMNPSDPYYYPSPNRIVDVEHEFRDMDERHLKGAPMHCIMGHTHVPGIGIFDPYTGKFSSYDADDAGKKIFIPRGARAMMNPGSVGQPRDGDPRASYIWGTITKDGMIVSIRRVPYDVERVQHEIIERGYPERNARRLASGR